MRETERVNADPRVNDQFLRRLWQRTGHLITVGGHKPFLLSDSPSVWVVYSGKVDVFAVRLENGQPVGVRHHLCRAETGQALFGMMSDPEPETGLLACGIAGTRLVKLELSDLTELVHYPRFKGSAEAVGVLVDSWVTALSAGIAARVPPRADHLLEPQDEFSLPDNSIVLPRKRVLWVKHLAGESHFMGRPKLPLGCSPSGKDVSSAISQDNYLPISPRTWLHMSGPSKLHVVETNALLRQDYAWSALDEFHHLVLKCVRLDLAQAEQIERQHLQNKTAVDHRLVQHAYARLASILEPEVFTPFVSDGDETGKRDPLLAACRLVGQTLGISIRSHRGTRNSQKDPVKDIARASRIRVRRIILRGKWWRADNGPLLAYASSGAWGTEKRPVALLPTSARRYVMLDPIDQTRTAVTADVAASLDSFAYVFYRPFSELTLTVWKLLRFGLQDTRKDLLMVLLMGLAGGILGTIAPLITGLIFDIVIPGAMEDQLVTIGLALLVSGLAAAAFQFTRGIAMLRAEGRMEASVQAAVWDRLLNLPVPFFHLYSAGDLADRAMGINTIRRTLSDVTVSSILSGVFSIFNFGLLFVYDTRLALVATGIVAVAVIVTLTVGYLQVHSQRALTTLQGRISGMVLQFATGIAKLRVAGVENRAFARWAEAFSEQKKLAFKIRSLANSLTTFNSAYPILMSIIIFAAVAFTSNDQARLSTGSFLGFSAAFTQFLSASLAVSTAFISTLEIIPIYERAKPILQTLPEVDEIKSDPGELRGEIEVNHVSFRYNQDEPLVLKDVSLHIKPGQFVALVGPSGSGKSTLLRLLLGFEAPDAGAIYYDGQNLSGIDVQAVRHQIGVVLQTSKLVAGSILTNITGSLLLPLEDAWEAARMAGLEQDIREMPMEMHTIVTEGGSTLSGGQRQRVLIARAIVNKPRILFFDEATSALDNQTQAAVNESMKRLSATRVVIAHRLSTVINADCIFVIDDGRIVESGTYDELMRQESLFAELAKRQLERRAQPDGLPRAFE